MIEPFPSATIDRRKDLVVEIDKGKIKTLDETGEPAPIDQVEDRVEAEMKRIEGKTKEQVATGLDNEDIARKGRKMKEDAEGQLKQLRQEKAE
jgi:uncharacterized protein YjbJ (UPF0337 family)